MRADERQAITRLIDTFGAEVLVSMPEFTPLNFRDSIRSRARAMNQVAQCTSCDLHAHCRAPVEPEFSVSPLVSSAIIIGESPTQDDDRIGQPFTGNIGRMVRSQLQRVGINPDYCAYTYVTSCRAHVDNQPVAPSLKEQAKCRENLLQTIAASNAKYILAFGMTAIRAWRDDVKVTQVGGKLFIWGDKFIYPMVSYQAVLRGAYQAVTWREEMARFGNIVGEDAGMFALCDKCVECDTRVFGYDPQGCSWCKQHLPMHLGKLATQGRRWGRQQTNQLELGVG